MTQTTHEPVVTVEALTHRYGSRVALDGLTLQVSHGEILALLGPNGSGKTTLFKILSTLLKPTSGAARIAGATIADDPDHVRRMIGVVFQSPALDDKLTVLENLTHQGHLYGSHGRALSQRIRSLLDQFDVADRAHDRAETLSGGLKRRVDIAKAMLHQPRVLLLDEPSTGLDPRARSTLFDQLVRLRDEEGVTTLLTTHLLDEADRSDRVAILDEGRLVARDTPSRLKDSIGGDVVTIKSGNAAALKEKIENRLDGPIALVNGCLRFEQKNSLALLPELMKTVGEELDSLTIGRPTLDDVFVRLTGHHLEEPLESAKR